ncbi:hypothetical protein ZIOFF_059716 [Zingiber officinale]|uniref:Uncharacterized protein n=2 Tax=Zingiber officinale TaxID=94328 RepID=A0A8J5KH45_ZINOF|nr:hypothetical protein ZIOFF_059716 [Zingiber officinale]
MLYGDACKRVEPEEEGDEQIADAGRAKVSFCLSGERDPIASGRTEPERNLEFTSASSATNSVKGKKRKESKERNSYLDELAGSLARALDRCFSNRKSKSSRIAQQSVLKGSPISISPSGSRIWEPGNGIEAFTAGLSLWTVYEADDALWLVIEGYLVMSYGHRRSNALEKIAYGRTRSVFRRSLDRSDRGIFAKPHEPDSGNLELRLHPFAFVLVDSEALRNGTNYSFILADTTDDGKLVESGSPSNMVGHDTSSRRLYMINLNTDCPRSSSSDIHGEASSSVQCKKNLSSTLGNSSVAYTNIDSSDFLVDLFPKVENKGKRKSRKKGKKKGKQHKRVSSRKDSNEADAQCNAKINSTSSLCSSDKHLSDNNSSDEVASVSLLDKDDSTNTNEFLDCQNSCFSTSFSDDIDDFKTALSSERFSGDELPSDTINSGSINNAAAVSFALDGSSRGEDFKENNNHDDNSSSIPKDKTSRQWDSDISENTSDDIVMQLPVKDETGLSFSEISKDCHSNITYLSNAAALDACSSTERADCIKQDDLSNGFHVVVSGRRRRRARKRMGNGALNGANALVNANIHSNAAKDDQFSTCPMVEKFGEECSKPNSIPVTTPQSELSSKDNKMESQNNKPVVPKKNLSRITSYSEANSKKAGQTLPKSIVGNSVNGVKCKPNSIAKNAKHNEGGITHNAKTSVPNGAKDDIRQREGFQNSLCDQFNSQTKTEAKLPGDKLSGRGISKLTDHCLPESEKKTPVLMEGGICPSEVSYILTTSKIEPISTQMNSECTLGSIVRSEGRQFRKLFFGSYRELSNLNSIISSPIQKSIPFRKSSLTDIDKIMLAINDASQQQRVVEYAQLMIGCPIADFEKLLFMASPIIRQTRSHNIYLKNIWQWYEEPGCFGLEVKAHEFRKSRRLPDGNLEFTAYFVPSLSAVQLFGMSGTSRNGDLNRQVDNTSADVCLLKFSSGEEDLSDQNTDIHQAELFFEYFESELPPWRQPLFNKIRELTAGDTLSGGCMFGNPSVLESTELQHLHPASWYCVAWYPIYRIPIGSLRAAFLTYHSLGNFISPSNPAYAPGSCDALVSPVVGLQTYNDKRENWFKPTDKGSNVLRTGTSSSELVKERLRTLRQTAAAMSCAVVSKGDCKSANKHPDYKFFMSRSG